MKKSVKKNMDVQKYKSFVGVAIWTVFRCWKTEQWAYNLQNKEGEVFWGNVKAGKGFQYEDEQVSINCVATPSGSTENPTFTFDAELVSKVSFVDGVREVKDVAVTEVKGSETPLEDKVTDVQEVTTLEKSVSKKSTPKKTTVKKESPKKVSAKKPTKTKVKKETSVKKSPAEKATVKKPKGGSDFM